MYEIVLAVGTGNEPVIDVTEPQPVSLNPVPVKVYELPVLVMVTVDTQQHLVVSQPWTDQMPSATDICIYVYV